MDIDFTGTAHEFATFYADVMTLGYVTVDGRSRPDCDCPAFTRHGVHFHAQVTVNRPPGAGAPGWLCTQHLPHPHGGMTCGRCAVCVAVNPAAAGMAHDEVADEVAGRVQDATGVRPDSSWLINVVKVDPNDNDPTDPHVTVLLRGRTRTVLTAREWAGLHTAGVNPATLTPDELADALGEYRAGLNPRNLARIDWPSPAGGSAADVAERC